MSRSRRPAPVRLPEGIRHTPTLEAAYQKRVAALASRVYPTPAARVAARLRWRRDELGWSQETLAAGMRAAGFGDFTRATIAQIETGRRRVSIDELVMLAYVLQIAIAPAPLEGETAPSPDERPSLLSGFGTEQAMQIGTAKWSESILRSPTPGVVNPDLTDAREVEAAAKLALDLGVSADDVSGAATRLWGHGIIAERERRVEAGDGGAGDTRTRRTHITRTLISELRRGVVEWFAAKAREAERQLAEVNEPAAASKRAKQAGQSTKRRSGR